MTEVTININKRFEVTLTNNQGNFVTGVTITYEIRNSITNVLADSGTLTEVSGLYFVDFTFTTLGQFRVLYFTPVTFPNDLELVDVTIAQANANDITNIISEIDDNEAKIDLLQIDLTQILSDVAGLNDLSIADIQTALINQGYTVVRAGNLDNLDVAVSTRSSHDAEDVRIEMDASSIDLNQILFDIASLNNVSIVGIQTALTNQGYTVVRADNLDNLDTTVSSRASEANATINKDAIIAEIDANELKIDGIQVDINTLLEKVCTIGALVHNNSEVVNQIHDTNGNLISAVVRGYSNATDLEAQTSVIREFNVTATFDSNQLNTFYRIKRVI